MNSLDIEIFHIINGRLHNNFLTPFFLFITNPKHLAIIFLLILMFWGLKLKKMSIFLLIILAAGVGFSDFTGNLIKHALKIPRPCNPICYIPNSNFDLGFKSSYSFPSNHTLNWFFVGFYFLLFSIYKKKYRFISMILLFLATVVSYSRIYLGVHFPSDVFGSILLAYLYSMLFFKIYLWVEKKMLNIKPNQES